MPELSMGGALISLMDNGEGEALLFVHGWMGSGALWDLMLPGLSERFRVIAPDLPGHADSGIPKGFAFTLDGFSSFIEELRVSLELESLVLVGHSMGGSISIHYAAHHPERVSRLVLIDAVGSTKALGWPVRLPFLEQLLGPYSRLWRKSTYARKIKNSVQHPDRLPSDWLDRAATQAAKLRREALLDTTHVVRNLDLDEEVASISVPVLLFHGDNDRSVKLAEAYRLRDTFKDARLHVVPDCGHCPNYEYPELVNELIMEFLSES